MDREEIIQIYQRLGPLIYRRCLRLLADPENARDATQEVFVRTLRHASKLPGDDECLPWLYRVATNYCLKKLRYGRRLEFRRPEDLPEPLGRATSERWLAARQQVVALLDLFDDKTRRIAVYAYMDGMTQEEISGLMGISRKTVGKKLRRFTERARELLQQERSA